VIFALGCSDTPPAETPATGGSAGVGGSSGGSSSAGGGGANAGTNATQAGSGGTPGSAGSTAMAAAGTGGSGGSAGGSAGGGGVGPGGITCTPGTNGNGVHDQPGPYGKPPEATVNAAVPAGTLTPLKAFQSTIYGHEFGYQVYVPAQYKQGQRAALMVVQDGPSHYLGKTEAKFFTNIVMDNLIAEGTVPVTIGLFIDVCMTTCEADRVTIYDDPSDKFSRFLTEEIVPQVITKDYTVVSDPEGWLGVGFSAGAMTSFSAEWHKPDLFKKLIGHNTSFPAAKDHGMDYITLVPQEPNKGFRINLVSGTADLSDDRGNWLEASKAMEMALTAKGYPVRLMTGTGGHYPPDQSAMDFPNALRWTWQGCDLADY
jgi:enterochelin esterase-like enzyme